MKSKNRVYYSPEIGVEQLIVYESRKKLDFSNVFEYARRQIKKEGFGILAENVYCPGILNGKWFDFSPGMTGLIIREKEDVFENKKILQMTCHGYSEHGQLIDGVAVPDYKALYFNLSIHNENSSDFVKKIVKYFDACKDIDSFYYQTYKIKKPIERIDFSSVIFFKDKDFLLYNINTQKLCEEILTLLNFPIEDKGNMIQNKTENQINSNLTEQVTNSGIHAMAEILSESHCILYYDEPKNIVVLHFYSCLGPKSGLQTAKALEKKFELTPIKIALKEIVINKQILSKFSDIKLISNEKKEAHLENTEVINN